MAIVASQTPHFSSFSYGTTCYENLSISSSMNIDGRDSSLKEGISATTSSQDNEERFTINIIIPPKPKGMNPDSRPSSPQDGIEGAPEYAEGPSKICAFQVMAPTQASKGQAKSGDQKGTNCLTNQDELAGAKLPFIWKLYEMLEDIERNSQEDIVSWVEEGQAFKVHKMDEFVEQIVPKYFKMSKYKSFQRQLYFYQFQRVSAGPHQGAYRHPNFQKGAKSACLTMVPKKAARRSSASKQQQQKERSKSMVDTTMNRAASDGLTVLRASSSPLFSQWSAQQRTGSGCGKQQEESHLLHQEELQETRATALGELPRRSSWPLYDVPHDMDGSAVQGFEDRSFHFVDVDFEDLGPAPSARVGTSARSTLRVDRTEGKQEVGQEFGYESSIQQYEV